MEKNEMATVTIEDIGVNGEGIGKVDGYTLFVKDTVIGDVVEAKIMKAKKNYGYARLIQVITPSPFRVVPKCKVARQCGGCQLQALSYEKQLDFKAKRVQDNLERIGGFKELPILPVIGMETPYYYRNKAQFPMGRDKDDNIITGFYAGGTHQIIANTDCAIGVPVNEVILACIIKFMKNQGISTYDEKTGKGLVRHVLIRYGFTTKEIMVCLVINGNKMPKSKELVKELCEIEGMTSITYSVNTSNTNVIMGNDIGLLWGQAYITDYIGAVKFQISPLSFYQVNPVQTEKLYELAIEYAGLTGEETVWDLYCGIGTISLFMAQKAKRVFGVEVVPQAIDDARKNALINDMENVAFYVGKAEEVLPREYEKNQIYADVVVLDPPRKGCDETLLETIVKIKAGKIVYVSCDSATLARDLRYLCDHGYEVRKVRGVDMFPQGVHVETVVSLARKTV